MVIFQKPNFSLILSAITLLLSFIFTGVLQALVISIFTIAGSIWSYEEVKNGASPIRKVFGIIGFCTIALFLFTKLNNY